MKLEMKPTLPKTNIAPENSMPKGNNRIKTIRFQVRLLLVSGRVVSSIFFGTSHTVVNAIAVFDATPKFPVKTLLL